MNDINTTLDNLKIGAQTTYAGLTTFALSGASRSSVDYLTLDEALNEKFVSIEEVSSSGSVPELLFRNRADKPVLLLDGEELVGAKQNRVLNLSILAPANAGIVIPVSCVESGRWSYSRPDFMSSGRAHFSKGRARKVAQVSQSLNDSGTYRSNQADVWHSISEKSARMSVNSATSAMSDIYDRHDVDVESYVEAFGTTSTQAGAVFAIGGQIAGCELFDTPEQFRKLYPKLIRSYALDAMEQRDTTATASIESAQGFLRELVTAEKTGFKAIGLGSDVRIRDEHLTGAALSVDDDLIHLCAFRLEKEPYMGSRPSRLHRRGRH